MYTVTTVVMYVYYESTRTHLYFAIFANFDPFAKLLKSAAVCNSESNVFLDDS